MDDEAHREFLLAALRTASARCKLMDNEVTSIGVALRQGMIDVDTALSWAQRMNLLWLLEPIPAEIAAATLPDVDKVPDIGVPDMVS